MRSSRALIAALVTATAAVSLASAGDATSTPSPAWLTKIDPWVLAMGAAGSAEFLVFLTEQADLAGAERLRTKAAKGRYVFGRLTETANRTQGPLLALLSERGIEHQPLEVANMIRVRGDLALAE